MPGSSGTEAVPEDEKDAVENVHLPGTLHLWAVLPVLADRRPAVLEIV